MGVYQTPSEYRSSFVAVSFIVVLVLMFLIAMTSPTDKDGNLQYEKHFLFQVLEPTFKLSAGLSIVTLVILVVLGLIAVVFCIGAILSS